MQCNIDRKGQIARLTWGVIMLVLAAVLVALALMEVWTGWSVWICVALAVAFGLLGIYEARKGWCIVRAMGVRTRW